MTEPATSAYISIRETPEGFTETVTAGPLVTVEIDSRISLPVMHVPLPQDAIIREPRICLPPIATPPSWRDPAARQQAVARAVKEVEASDDYIPLQPRVVILMAVSHTMLNHEPPPPYLIDALALAWGVERRVRAHTARRLRASMGPTKIKARLGCSREEVYRLLDDKFVPLDQPHLIDDFVDADLHGRAINGDVWFATATALGLAHDGKQQPSHPAREIDRLLYDVPVEKHDLIDNSLLDAVDRGEEIDAKVWASAATMLGIEHTFDKPPKLTEAMVAENWGVKQPGPFFRAVKLVGDARAAEEPRESWKGCEPMSLHALARAVDVDRKVIRRWFDLEAWSSCCADAEIVARRNRRAVERLNDPDRLVLWQGKPTPASEIGVGRTPARNRAPFSV